MGGKRRGGGSEVESAIIGILGAFRTWEILSMSGWVAKYLY